MDTNRFGLVDCCVICRSIGCECPLRLLRTDFSKGSSCYQVARSIVARSFFLIAFYTPKRAADVDCVRFDGRQIKAISIVLMMASTAATTPPIHPMDLQITQQSTNPNLFVSVLALDVDSIMVGRGNTSTMVGIRGEVLRNMLVCLE